MSRLTALIALIALPFFTIAADEPKKEPPDREKLLRATPEEIVKAFDKNDDGKLDVKEVEAMLRVMRDRQGGTNPPARPEGDRAVAAVLERLDANKDGKISKDEAKGPLAENFARIDRNSDGFIDKEELKPIAERLAGGQPGRPEGERFVAQMLERLDANKDGKISKDEAKGPLAENFARIDRNSDGALDKEELKAAAERLAGQGGAPGRPTPPSGPEFDPNDKDADGRLTKDEVKGTPLADKFDAIDANKDGKIDRKEFDAFTKKP